MKSDLASWKLIWWRTARKGRLLKPSIEELRASFTGWVLDEGKLASLSEEVVKAYELANPLGMSADGLLRYWKKVRNAG